MEIRLEGIEKRFGDVLALKGVSFDAHHGELLTLLGPSGCGKTTILRIIAGLVRPDSGRVLFNGKDMTDSAPEKRNVGMVFQNYALFPHMNVFDNIAFGLSMRKLPRPAIRKRVDEVVELVGLGGYEDRKPSELSGGEQQRVALARAIAPEPDILLLDEPLSALDARLRISLRSEIKRIQGELGITAVYVTHDREEAMAISDRMAVMNRGVLEQVGTPAETYRSPKNLFVASFLGDANLIPVYVKNGTAETPFGDIHSEEDGKAYLFFRPSDCVISGEGVPAEILSVEPAGDVVRVRLKLGKHRISLLSTDAGGLSAGQRTGIRVKTGAFRIIMDDAVTKTF